MFREADRFTSVCCLCFLSNEWYAADRSCPRPRRPWRDSTVSDGSWSLTDTNLFCCVSQSVSLLSCSRGTSALNTVELLSVTQLQFNVEFVLRLWRWSRAGRRSPLCPFVLLVWTFCLEKSSYYNLHKVTWVQRVTAGNCDTSCLFVEHSWGPTGREKSVFGSFWRKMGKCDLSQASKIYRPLHSHETHQFTCCIWVLY